MHQLLLFIFTARCYAERGNAELVQLGCCWWCWVQLEHFIVCWSGRTMVYHGLLVLVSRLIFWLRSSRESTRLPVSTRCSVSSVTSYFCKG